MKQRRDSFLKFLSRILSVFVAYQYCSGVDVYLYCSCVYGLGKHGRIIVNISNLIYKRLNFKNKTKLGTYIRW